MLVDDPHFRPAPGRHLAGAFDPGIERVARPHRLQPADLVDPRRAQRRALVDVVVDEQPHQLGCDVPARGYEATEHRLPGGAGIDVEALRIVLAGEVHNFVGSEAGGAEIELLADLVVIPVTRGLGVHASRSSQRPTAEARTSYGLPDS